jgi:ABC-2 type transport system permease protein
MTTHAAYEMRGPSALGGGLRRFAHLTRALAITDFKLRFFDSILGYLWTLMRPLMLFGVLYAVFSVVVRVGNRVDFYPVILLSGMILYFYFSEATNRAVACVVDNENLVRKIHFPRLAIPLSTVGTVSLQLALNLIVLFFFMVVSGVHAGVRWLELPVILLPLLVLTVGAAMLLSALYVMARDVSPIWEVVTQALFYVTPVLYPIELLADRSQTLAHLAMMNPLAAVIQQARHALIDPHAPSAGTAIGGPVWLVVPAGITVAVFVVGFYVFNRMAPRIAEEL